MAERVQFVVMAQADYDELEKDEYTFYKCYDSKNVYLGTEQLNDIDFNESINIGATNIVNGSNICTEITDEYWEDSAWNGGGTGIFSGNTNTDGIASIDIVDAPNPHIKVGWLLDNELDTTQSVKLQQRQIPLQQDGTYTMSCYARGVGTLRLYLSTTDNGYADYTVDGNWKRYSYTSVLQNIDVGKTLFIALGSSEGGADARIEICGMKLEVGEIATDWSPSPADVAVATSTTTEPLVWGSFGSTSPIKLANYTPSEIQDIVSQGEASNYWSLGDTIPITLNGDAVYKTYDNEVVYAFIIGFDHNKNLETNGKHSMTLQFGKTEDGIDIALGESDQTPQINELATSVGGWEDSYIRKTICPAFYKVLPPEWQAVVGTINKYTDNEGNGSGDVEANVSMTQEQIFIPSAYELQGNIDYTSSSRPNQYEKKYQKTYDYYKQENSLAKGGEDSPTTLNNYWTRSCIYRKPDSFCCLVSITDDTVVCAEATANLKLNFIPAFTIVAQ